MFFIQNKIINSFLILLTFNVFIIIQAGRDKRDTVCGELSEDYQNQIKLGFPWLVSIQNKIAGRWIHECSGVIISKNWVLTSASCFHNPSKKEIWRVSEGSPMGGIFEISRIIIHEDFIFDSKSNYPQNDIALLQIEERFSGDEGHLMPICLPSSSRDFEGMATISGFGTKSDSLFSLSENFLYSFNVLVDRTCSELKSQFSNDKRFICTNPSLASLSIPLLDCIGDGGVPLQGIEKDSGRVILIGVSAFIHQLRTSCGGIDHDYGVYTKINSYIDWIHGNTDIRKQILV